jgi:hypothetical protein
MNVRTLTVAATALILSVSLRHAGADPLDINKIIGCQRQIANQGARFADDDPDGRREHSAARAR